MTIQLTVSLNEYQPRAAMVEVVTADGRSTERAELLPGQDRLVTLHSGASLRVEEGRMVPQQPRPPKPDPGPSTAEGGE